MTGSGGALAAGDTTAAAHRATLQAIAEPGAWWSGEDRVAIVRAARAAPSCALCADTDIAERLENDRAGREHDNDGTLPPIAVEAVHGIRNDSGRLTRRWFDHVIDMGMLAESYVELVAVTASSIIIDTFAKGIGAELSPLPDAVPGEPSLERSERRRGCRRLATPCTRRTGQHLALARLGSQRVEALLPGLRKLVLHAAGFPLLP